MLHRLARFRTVVSGRWTDQAVQVRIGAFLASALNIGFAGFRGSLVVSTVGAIVLLWIVGMVRGKRAI